MSILDLLQKFRSGRSVRVGDRYGTIEGTALMMEHWGHNPRRARMILVLRVREMRGKRYTGSTFNVNSNCARLV